MRIDGRVMRDYNLTMTVTDSAAQVLRTLEAAGESAWLVGGCVRDALRGVTPHDFDICTSALPEKTLALFENAHPTGVEHGTVTVVIGGEPIEVTTYRSDGEYADRRHPTGVTFVRSIEQDLARRDFTVNAMAWSPERGLCDPFGGKSDLERGILRAVGDPRERFREDALRMLRALRFAARCEFEVERETAAAMHELRELVRDVSAERVTSELIGLLECEGAADIALEYRDLLAVRLPSLENAPDEVFTRLAREKSRDPVTRLALLAEKSDIALLRLRRADAQSAGKIRSRLQSGAPRSVADTMRLVQSVGERDALRCLYAYDACGEDTAPARELLMLLPADYLCRSAADLKVGGREMLALGISGTAAGEMLARLMDLVTDGILPNERTALLAAAKALPHIETNAF